MISFDKLCRKRCHGVSDCKGIIWDVSASQPGGVCLHFFYLMQPEMDVAQGLTVNIWGSFASIWLNLCPIWMFLTLCQYGKVGQTFWSSCPWLSKGGSFKRQGSHVHFFLLLTNDTSAPWLGGNHLGTFFSYGVHYSKHLVQNCVSLFHSVK
jgi:hypothetical protein